MCQRQRHRYARHGWQQSPQGHPLTSFAVPPGCSPRVCLEQERVPGQVPGVVLAHGREQVRRLGRAHAQHPGGELVHVLAQVRLVALDHGHASMERSNLHYVVWRAKLGIPPDQRRRTLLYCCQVLWPWYARGPWGHSLQARAPRHCSQLRLSSAMPCRRRIFVKILLGLPSLNGFTLWMPCSHCCCHCRSQGLSRGERVHLTLPSCMVENFVVSYKMPECFTVVFKPSLRKLVHSHGPAGAATHPVRIPCKKIPLPRFCSRLMWADSQTSSLSSSVPLVATGLNLNSWSPQLKERNTRTSTLRDCHLSA